jgi:hypothetical protein
MIPEQATLPNIWQEEEKEAWSFTFVCLSVVSCSEQGLWPPPPPFSLRSLPIHLLLMLKISWGLLILQRGAGGELLRGARVNEFLRDAWKLYWALSDLCLLITRWFKDNDGTVVQGGVHIPTVTSHPQYTRLCWIEWFLYHWVPTGTDSRLLCWPEDRTIQNCEFWGFHREFSVRHHCLDQLWSPVDTASQFKYRRTHESEYKSWRWC